LADKRYRFMPVAFMADFAAGRSRIFGWLQQWQAWANAIGGRFEKCPTLAELIGDAGYA
jgi:hypothetical protein